MKAGTPRKSLKYESAEKHRHKQRWRHKEMLDALARRLWCRPSGKFKHSYPMIGENVRVADDISAYPRLSRIYT